MAQFDYYQWTEQASYVIDVQHGLLDALGTRVIIPLVPAAIGTIALSRLHPVIEISGRVYQVAPHLIATVRQEDLGAKVGSLSQHRDRIIAAMDMLVTGI